VHSYTAGALGHAYLLNKETARALSVLKEGTKPEYLERGIWTVQSLTVLADAYRVTGEINQAMETILRALKLASESEEQGFESWAMLVMARTSADAGRTEDAKQWYQRALKQAADLSMLPLVAHCHEGLGAVHFHLGEKNVAKSEFDTAHEMYRSLGMTYFLNSLKLI
jgi:tetratricopeptide (TPR) repeat protein